MYTGSETLYQPQVYVVSSKTALVYVGTDLQMAQHLAGQRYADVDIWQKGKQIGKFLWSARLRKWVEI